VSFEEILRAIIREELAPLEEELERALGTGCDELLTPAQAAELAKVAPATLRKWARTGALTNRGSPRASRYRRSEVLNVKVADRMVGRPRHV